MSNRSATLVVRNKQTTGGNIPASALFGEPFVNLYDGILRFSGATGGAWELSTQNGVFEVGSNLYNQKITNRLSINGNFIISGGTGMISTYNGTSGAGLANKFLSGTTGGFVLANISDISAASAGSSGDIQYNNGSNGFGANSSFNFNSASSTLRVNRLSATTLTATTILSGANNTSLETIIYNIANSTENITTIQPGTNIATGGTTTAPIISTVASPGFNNLIASGATQLNNSTSVTFSGGTLSGGTIFSGNTDLSIFFGLDRAQISTKANLSGATFTGAITGPSANITSLTGGTIFSGNTDLSVFFGTIGAQLNTKANLSGATFTGGIVGTTANFTTLSASTIFSGNTNLYSIFATLGSIGQVTIQPGVNIATGGTAIAPIISTVASPGFNNLVASGATQLNTASAVSFSAATLSGGSIFSGSTNLSTFFGTIGAQLNTKANLSGATFTGAIVAPNITNSALTPGRLVYSTTNGLLTDTATLNFDGGNNTLNAPNIIVGSPALSGNVIVWGNLTIHGDAISGFTSQLYIEDNLIELNFNPTASTTSTSLGSGWSIQDGSGIQGTPVFFDIRGTNTGVANRGFATNLEDIRIRETGTVSAPNGVRVLAEYDVIDGGQY